MLELLRQLGVDTQDYDRWGLAFAGASSPLTWVLIALAALALVFWNASSTRDLTNKKLRLFLIVWQVLTMIALVAVMLRPSIQLAKTAKIKDRVVALIDSSASMSLPAESGGDSRAQAAADFIADESGFFDRLERDYSVLYLAFDAATRDLGARPAAPVPPEGEATDILAALSSIGASGAPLAGVILLSDGTDTSRLGRRFLEGSDPSELGRLLADFPAPVNTVALGDGVEVKDLGIARVVHDDYGFVHNPFEVEVQLRTEGGLAGQVPVIFKQGDRVLATKTLQLEPGQRTATAKLDFTPRQVGEFMFSVEVPPAPGEVTAANNLVRFPLKILRDKVRILYIVGSPSWDESFLRRSLKKDPAVDLVCFYILRQIEDDPHGSEQELSLIKFPTHELFIEEIDTFDLIVWQNFSGRPYMPEYARYMDSLNRYVRERGGGLLMIGGPRAYHGLGEVDPKLADLFPFTPSNVLPNYQLEDFKPKLTEQGARHPIMEINDEGQSVEEVWGLLPVLPGYNLTGKLVPGALALAVHPAGPAGLDGPGAADSPLIAVMEAGAGRVMTIMTDGSWRWNFAATGAGVSNKYYQRFFENSLRWLLRDPELRLVTLSADRGKVAPGAELNLSIEVLDESYNPTDGATVRLEAVEQPEGAALALPEPVRTGVGRYRVTIKPATAGAYRLRAIGALQGRPLGYDDEIFEASRETAEWSEVMPRPELLAQIGAATKGAAISKSGDPDAFKFKPAKKEQIIGQKDLPLWDNWRVWTGCFLLMVVGWFIRRRWGLL